MTSNDYPSDWDSRRKEVYNRSNHQCSYCSRSGGPNHGQELHAHHIVPISEGGGHDLSNLVALCEDCHRAVHTSAHFPALVDEKADSFRQQVSDTAGSVSSHSSVAGEYFETMKEIVNLLYEAKRFGSMNKTQLRQKMSSEAELATNLRKQTTHTKVHINQLEEMLNDSTSKVHLKKRDVETYIETVKVMMKQTVEMLDLVDNLYEDLEGACACTSCGDVTLDRDMTCKKCGVNVNIAIEEIADAFLDYKERITDLAERTAENDDRNVAITNKLAEQS